MQPLFMDESGDLGFGCGTAYFILAFIAPDEGRVLGKAVKNFNAHLIRQGWNQSVEIKATNVWHAAKNPLIPHAYGYRDKPHEPMEAILKSVASIKGYIEYAAVKLNTVKPSLQAAPCAILYNYFSWLLLRNPLCWFNEVELFVDKRSREYHSLLKFDGYLEGKAGIERAERSKGPVALHIRHYDWHSPNEFKAEQRARVEYGVRGIEAADFICWAIKKKYEDGDERWYALIKDKIRRGQKLYFEQ